MRHTSATQGTLRDWRKACVRDGSTSKNAMGCDWTSQPVCGTSPKPTPFSIPP